jgi:hypothetical protein
VTTQETYEADEGTITMDLTNNVQRCGLDPIWLRLGPLAGSCEHGNDIRSLKYVVFLTTCATTRFSKNDTTPYAL